MGAQLNVNGADLPEVECPECQYNHSHIRRVFTRVGYDLIEGSVYEGTQAVECAAWRRSGLVIQFDGECGHAWNMVIQQHKGINFIEFEMIEPLKETK